MKPKTRFIVIRPKQCSLFFHKHDGWASVVVQYLYFLKIMKLE